MPVGVSHVGRDTFRNFQIARHGDIIETTLCATEALSLDGKEEKIEDDRASFSCVTGTSEPGRVAQYLAILMTNGQIHGRGIN